ncbi:peptidoglycan-binding protein [Leucobacter aridicollis]|uniref:Multidrug efflux pump subunit AcrA (Membrane-fusion protein) n=1 Tax=Leucobacter aridicollis TaxID=283878 RepID=A0A852RJE6_9MICO|nr:peptidoglycan-binding protein [Leucobacter aridicollis]MBL3680759.1 HlyD family efflux transporter periplasmic adaptor subunit [Leucobacter aridicollis]NYD28254.1 multidrug efflux pump subunit AcrA (membrane-fusion protein) [Leucobacter aridicollis]
MRKLWIAVAATVAVAGLAATGLVLLRPAPAAPVEERAPGATAKVEQGDLVERTLVQGSLGYAGERAISGGAGTLTSRAKPGSMVDLGGELFAIDNSPVALFRGPLPQWRSFELGMTNGPDVQQLEASLGELGYFWGGADEIFDDNTRIGIRLWQEATGRPVTGEIGLGEIFFAPGSLRVASAELEPGAATAPGTPILRVSELGKSVSVELKLAQQRLGVVGAKVEVELPGGVKTPGTVTAVEPPRTPEKQGDGAPESPAIVPVTVTLDTPEDAADIDRASVRIAFTSETRENVLSVPVGALLALPGGGYGLEVVGPDGAEPQQVPVETGMFAGGMVEVSGEGIKAGTEVVTAAS